jgi:hypothetical protein
MCAPSLQPASCDFTIPSGPNSAWKWGRPVGSQTMRHDASDAQRLMAEAIARTNVLIAEQEARIVRLEMAGASTTRSREFLATLKDALELRQTLLRLCRSYAAGTERGAREFPHQR